MKKLLLTLGTVASITAPLATVIACGEGDVALSGTYDPVTKTATLDGFVIDPGDTENDYSDIIKDLKNSGWSDATTLIIKGTYGDHSYEGEVYIPDLIIDENKFENLGSLAKYESETSNIWTTIFDASASDFDSIRPDLGALHLVSNHADGSSWGFREKFATSFDEANDWFGISQSEFDKILDVFEDEFRLEYLMFSYSSTPYGYETETIIKYQSIKQPHRDNMYPEWSYNQITFAPPGGL